MKKITALTLCLFILFSLAACKSDSGSGFAGVDHSGGDSNDIGGTSTSYTLGNLTKNIFEIAKSGTYRMEFSIIGENINDNYAEYAKDGMFAIDIGMRTIYKDGKSYLIMDAFEIVMAEDAEPDEEIERFLPEESTLTYIGEGSGEFKGKTYKYDEYLNDKGLTMYFYVDDGVFKGIQTIEANGSLTDMEIIAFDQNVPDSVFEIPAHYEIMEEE
jgi:hypothetical protein